MIYWSSPAKLNLFLYITGRRDDGYHKLQTLFQFLNYGDTIAIKPRNNGQINLLTPMKGIKFKKNLIILAARLLIEEASKKNCLSKNSGADIIINKKLPIGGGLGGGSSNAATILVALNHLWKCKFKESELLTLALKLGADVPVFVYGRAALAEGTGEILSPAFPKKKWYLVANPRIQISTSEIFKDSELKRDTPERNIRELMKCKFINVCEAVVRKRFYKVDATISWLLKYAPARLTGTGSCVFAEFNSKSSAIRILKKAPSWIDCFVAKGINLSPLKQETLAYKNYNKDMLNIKIES